MSQPATDTVFELSQLRTACATCGLHALCLPASIGAEDIQRLDDVVQSKRPLDTEQVLVAQGDRMRSLYVVRSGSFKTLVANEHGEPQVLGFHLPGEIVGIDALANDVHQCSVQALERSTVCEVPFDHLQSVARQVPGLQRQLMRVISREVVRDQEHLVMMGRKQAQERLAIFLKSLSDRYQRLRLDPATLNLTMSRADLANYLGLVVETVSRLFTRMADTGVLEVKRRTVRILDMQALTRLCEGASTD